EMFLRDNRGDSDFSAFMSIWFFEEQKHSLVLMEYLRRFRPDLVPTEQELHEVRFEFEPAPALETLMLHFCGEIRLNHWYRRAAEWHTEPVIKHIYQTLSQDEARHGGAYLRYMKRAINKFGVEAQAAFAKVGVLMASARRTAQALHPTNLHVNKALFPRDTIQSRVPKRSPGCRRCPGRWCSRTASSTSCTAATSPTSRRRVHWAAAWWWRSIPTLPHGASARARTGRSMANRTAPPSWRRSNP